MIIFWREESSMNDEVCISIYMPPPCCPRFIYAQKKRLKAASAWAATVPLSFAFFVCSSPIGLCAAEQYKSHMHNLTRAHIMMFFYFLFFAFFFFFADHLPISKMWFVLFRIIILPKMGAKEGIWWFAVWEKDVRLLSLVLSLHIPEQQVQFPLHTQSPGLIEWMTPAIIQFFPLSLCLQRRSPKQTWSRSFTAK